MYAGTATMNLIVYIHTYTHVRSHTLQEANTLKATGNMDAGMAQMKYIVHVERERGGMCRGGMCTIYV